MREASAPLIDGSSIEQSSLSDARAERLAALKQRRASVSTDGSRLTTGRRRAASRDAVETTARLAMPVTGPRRRPAAASRILVGLSSTAVTLALMTAMARADRAAIVVPTQTPSVQPVPGPISEVEPDLAPQAAAPAVEALAFAPAHSVQFAPADVPTADPMFAESGSVVPPVAPVSGIPASLPRA